MKIFTFFLIKTIFTNEKIDQIITPDKVEAESKFPKTFDQWGTTFSSDFEILIFIQLSTHISKRTNGEITVHIIFQYKKRLQRVN